MFAKKKFRDIDLNDEFFDSLKQDYAEFPAWFAKKADSDAYVLTDDETQRIHGFLYLKIEEGEVEDVVPPLPPAKRLKVGTLKINAHGTKLGERFIKKIFDHAIYEDVEEIYVTVFEQHEGLIRLLNRYGFQQAALKPTINGVEQVLIKYIFAPYKDVLTSYPLVAINGSKSYLLSIQPQWHTRLLPDSILNNEGQDIVQDVSHTNSIHKVYLASMRGMDVLQPRDVLLIYRTTDNQGPARYRSVATSLCVVEEYRSIHSFRSEDEFLIYCSPYSVFDEAELREFWRHKRYVHVVRFAYNIALKRRITRAELIDEVGLNSDVYWGFMPLTNAQVTEIANRGGVDARLIVN
ncbi:N-acetyltransferase [Lysobacter sp. M15]|uniref:N-acetyltransferase n=1 Tax=Lysobacter sp. M15 TaxID=2916837 RepID=UPI001F5AB23C|nr:N-acetyltransferase [Lysobacter sp. M15]